MNMEAVRTLMVADEGIVDRNLIHPDDLPSRTQAELCKEWLSKLSKKRQLPQGNRQNSYYLKHVVEEATGAHVTNGAFIQAALELGFRCATIDGPNAFFHEKAAIYAFSECETRWDDQIDGFPPLDDALLNVDK
jgi:hypothetical protein